MAVVVGVLLTDAIGSVRIAFGSPHSSSHK